MASKKNTPAKKTSAPKTVIKSKSAPVVTPVRNTTIPPKKAATPAAAIAKKIAPTFEQISARAYFSWQSNGGSQDENWFRAEQELRNI